ncbi:nucleotidyltransferase [Streptomyces sp. NBC_01288]|uniref:nucleotidyltransferase domain-containing protein n=1 Tax=Streptomyces sp. NBC_01288 TaxID=2903814 RepID=UPI002E1477BE|nr:nucleotidyltransferase [Streptomyces sp. NBC_01288]
MTALEEKLTRYKARSSNTEQEKQERAKRMVRAAVNGWSGFTDITLSLLPKGSYKNNTNVRADSDVDIAVIHEGFYYFNDADLREGDKVVRHPITRKRYAGADFRGELEKAMCAAYGTDCDTSGSTAIEIAENGGRVKADVVPSFRHRKYYYDAQGNVRYFEGTRTLRTNGEWVINYPEQQYANGVAKNHHDRTGMRYKQMVRILKRVENDLVTAGKIEALPSYFMECLVYCVPDNFFNHQSDTPLTDDFTAIVRHIWNKTKPNGTAKSWNEPNDIKPLFGDRQKWSIDDAHQLALKTWQHLELGD